MSPDNTDAELAPLFAEAALSLGMPRAVLARVLHAARTDEEKDARAELLAAVLEIALENEIELSDEARERLDEIELDTD